MSTPAKPRRPKRHATVAPSELARTLHTKLDAAKLKLLDVQKAEQPRGGGSESHRDLDAVRAVGACREIQPQALARLVGWKMTLKEVALRMRCSRCGRKSAEVIAVARPRPRGVPTH